MDPLIEVLARAERGEWAASAVEAAVREANIDLAAQLSAPMLHGRDEASIERYLEALETLGLAARQARRHYAPWAAKVAEALEHAVEAGGEVVDGLEDPWRFARLGEDPGRFPWSRLGSAVDADAVRDDRAAAFIAWWRRDRLGFVDATEVERRVAGPWNEEYRRAVEADLRPVRACGLPRALVRAPALSIALGGGRAIELWSFDRRVELRRPGAPLEVISPGRTAELADPGFGSLRVEVPLELASVAHEVGQVHAARGVHLADPEARRALSTQLASERWVGVMARAARAASVRAASSDLETVEMIFELRLGLERAEEADAALAPHGQALELIPDERYAAIAAGRALDPSKWWGARERRALPPSPSPPTRRRFGPWLVAAALLVVLVLALWSLPRRRPPPPDGRQPIELTAYSGGRAVREVAPGAEVTIEVRAPQAGVLSLWTLGERPTLVVQSRVHGGRWVVASATGGITWRLALEHPARMVFKISEPTRFAAVLHLRAPIAAEELGTMELDEEPYFERMLVARALEIDVD